MLPWFANEPFVLTASLFERCLAILNILVFLSSLSTYDGLFSSRGLSPATDTIHKMRQRGLSFVDRPTLCLYSCSDTTLLALHVLGVVAGVLAFFGVCSGLCLAVCGLCYQSLKNVAGPFLGLQMHAHLVESDYLYVLASPFLLATPLPLMLLNTALVSRVMFGGAVGKWTGGDKSWHDGTSMSWHYWSQPLPNVLSPYFHRLPLSIHRLETYATLVLEGGGAIACWGPLHLRLVGFLCFAAILLMINVTGNYGFLAQLTMTDALCLLNDDFIRGVLVQLPFGEAVLQFLTWTFYSKVSLAYLLRLDRLFGVVGLSIVPYVPVVLYIGLGLIPVAGVFNNRNPLHLLTPLSSTPLQLYDKAVALPPLATLSPYIRLVWEQLQSLYPYVASFDIALRYVKFQHMTKRRYELVLQGSHDGKTWIEYDWRAKPGNPHRRPGVHGPHIPMLDWRLWFLGNEHARGLAPPVWYDRLCVRLLQGEPRVEALVRVPGEFSGEGRRPVYIRTLVYDYRFVYGHEADSAEKAEEEARRRAKATSVREEAKRLMDEDDEQDDGDEDELREWRLVKRREGVKRRGYDVGSTEENAVKVNESDFWYRLRFVGQYGQTYTLDNVERRLL